MKSKGKVIEFRPRRGRFRDLPPDDPAFRGGVVIGQTRGALIPPGFAFNVDGDVRPVYGALIDDPSVTPKGGK